METFEKRELDKIEKQLRLYDELRDEVIKKSREIIKQSKIVINSVHREEDSDKGLEQLNTLKEEMDQILGKTTGLKNEGSAKVAYQEFVEARLMTNFRSKEKMLWSELGVDEEAFLLGLCDLTGELARMAVRKATSKEFDEVKRAYDCIEEAHSFFLKLDLRNSELRKKSDQVKWNLKKTEEILYDISLRE